jgi:ribosomal protein S12 methylthiotransferase
MGSNKIPRIGFVSLGCPKAGSDTEKIMSRVKTKIPKRTIIEI